MVVVPKVLEMLQRNFHHFNYPIWNEGHIHIYDIDCDIFVVAIQVRIFGGPDIYVREGSSLQLECVISQTIVSPKVSPYLKS